MDPDLSALANAGKQIAPGSWRDAIVAALPLPALSRHGNPTGGGPNLYMVEPEHVHLLAAPLTNSSPGPGPGSADRAAALALHSQIQRAVTGRSARGPHTQPEYLVEPEDAHLLVPFTNPGPSRANHNKT